MNKKKILLVFSILVFSILTITIVSYFIFIKPLNYSNECKNRIYEDIQAKIDEDITNSCVSFLWEDKSYDNGVKTISCNSGNNGVIISKDGNKYCVATANHIVLDSNLRVMF